MPELSQNEKKVLLVIIFFLLIGGGVRLYSLFFGGDDFHSNMIPLNQDALPVPTSNPLPEYQETKAAPLQQGKKIVAHVCGAVKVSGVYTLPPDSRVKDFIDAAGGADENAALDSINLARIVQDGEQIIVPAIKTPQAVSSVTPGDFPNRSPQGPVDSNSSIGGKVDINTATLGELDSLPGVGPIIAKRIMDYRDKNGAFKTIEDIKKVKGVGEKTYADLKDFIIVR